LLVSGWGCLFLWQKRVVDTWVHIHIQPVSTWRYVVLVEKTALATPKQALNQVANTESKSPQLQTCGVP
jgi:hypothetical protein